MTANIVTRMWLMIGFFWTFALPRAVSAEVPYAMDWSRQLGTSGDDRALAVAADGLGSVYIAGSSNGSLGGPNAGGTGPFFAKYDAAGSLRWVRQPASEVDYSSLSVSADVDGNAFVAGVKFGSYVHPNYGVDLDAFVSKYDAVGNLQWTRQSGSDYRDSPTAISADGFGNVYFRESSGLPKGQVMTTFSLQSMTRRET